jgi:hypothetical protein
MKRLLHRSIPVPSWFQKTSRYYPFTALLIVGLMALAACAPAAAPTNTPPPTVPPTETPVPNPTPTPGMEMVPEPAPVESVAIEISATDPSAAELVLVTGLPGGCHEFDNYTLEREGDTFRVTVTNLRPADETIPCTMIYGYHETRVALPGEIEACRTYDVMVNDEPFSARAEGPAVTCETETPMRQEPAPIESVTIDVQSIDPLRASMVVVSGLPNACYSFDSYTISRDGDTFQVEIINVVPDDPDLMCAEVYGLVTTSIPMQGDIEVCHTYTVNINDETHQVQAIAPNVRCANGEAVTGMEVMVGMGQSAAVAETGLTVTLLEVTEDSRCPSDAICIQPGQATVLVMVEQNGEELGELSLTLAGGQASSAETLEGYDFWLGRLDPYPVSTAEIDPQDYVAHIVVASAGQPDA